jgi:hypothetical protein
MAKSKASKKSAKRAKGTKKASKKAAKASKKAAKASKRTAKAARRTAKASKKTAKASKKTAKAPKTRAAKPTRAKAANAGAKRRLTRAKAVAKPAPRKTTPPAATAARKAARSRTAAALGKRPNLDRDRRTVREEEEMVPSPPSSLDMDRHGSAARTGRAEYEQRLRLHTSTGPAMTGGDIDADWEDAETVGDEAPGGDNPTPDQDIVDEIGKAMGIQYDDDEELQGGDELAERDRHRWELDPASKEDFEEE